MKIGITGQSGFIGYHVSKTIKYKFEKYNLVTFHKSYFEDTTLFDAFISSCDVIIHLAGVNRADSEKEVYTSNIQLNNSLKNALLRAKFKGHLIFASSTQEDSTSLYGLAKKESRVFLEQTVKELGGNFTGLIIPNVFGPFCKPNYNSFIATFCHKILNEEIPEIFEDMTVPLIYVGNLTQEIIDIIQSNKEIKLKYLEPDIEIKVSEVQSLLNYFKEYYLQSNTIPFFKNLFELQLFNTFRSYIDLNKTYPIKLNMHTDERGFFSEIIKTQIGGQFSFSTTLPNISRGNHFHTRKIERFIVLQGKAKIYLRKIGSNMVHEFLLDGDKPSFVDMPIWYTHKITNIGKGQLITSFWINEPYNFKDADTYFENV